jgi:hypothetical protein
MIAFLGWKVEKIEVGSLTFLQILRTACLIHHCASRLNNHAIKAAEHKVSSGRSLPLIFCIHVRSGPIYWGGVIHLAKKIIRWWYFTCKKPEYFICNGILHVNMFHLFKIPYFTCNFFIKLIYLQWIYWTLFFIARCSTIFAQWSPPESKRWRTQKSDSVAMANHWNPLSTRSLGTTLCKEVNQVKAVDVPSRTIRLRQINWHASLAL